MHECIACCAEKYNTYPCEALQDVEHLEMLESGGIAIKTQLSPHHDSGTVDLSVWCW